jgi:hypothetical protein
MKMPVTSSSPFQHHNTAQHKTTIFSPPPPIPFNKSTHAHKSCNEPDLRAPKVGIICTFSLNILVHPAGKFLCNAKKKTSKRGVAWVILPNVRRVMWWWVEEGGKRVSNGE